MSESADNEEDMSNIMDEAQALMEEMGDEEGVGLTESIVIDGFSIDDIMGDDSGGNIIDARTFTNSSTASNVPVEKVEEGQDPLSLVANSMSHMTTTAAGTETNPSASASPSNRRSSLTALHDEIPMQSAVTLNAPSFSEVKARATGFASTVASFAKTAAQNVQAAAAQAAVPMPPPMQAGSAVMSMSPAVELDNDQKTALVQQHLGTLLPGERVIMFLSNLLHVSDSASWDYTITPGSDGMWCCCMTFYRVVVFYTGSSTAHVKPPPENWDQDCWPASPPTRMLQMPLASMDRVEKSIYTTVTNTTLMGLVMYGKDNGRQLRFTTPSYADTLRVHESIQTYAFPGRRNLGYLFAFESKRAQVMNSIITDPATGKKTITLAPVPKRCDPLAEFARQFGSMNPCPWALYTKMNETYQLCMSYPSVLVGPSSLPEASSETQRVLRQMAGFRSEQRITSLTWSSGVDGASLWRASQPKVGLQGNRNAADEFYLRHIGESAASSNSIRLDGIQKPSKEWIQKLTGQPDFGQVIEPGTTLKILDLRPRASAMANRTQGYGYENTSHYVGTTLTFLNISNIHAVRDSYQKMSAHCLSATAQDASWNSLIEDTKWLHHIRQIWNAAWEAAFWIHVHRMPVLVHCSHGWDRTSQVAVLTELLLDPHYRTRAGFACLVEKDFMSFGHPFHTRCAHGEGRGAESSSGGGGGSDEGQISPIFLQFIDCVYQLISLYPNKFEFNEMYLLVMSEHVYSCRFGTLLCDTERERELVAGIRQRTHSLWDYLEARTDCINTNYAPGGVLLMPLPTLLRSIHLWTNRHVMYGPKPTGTASVQPLTVVPAKDTVVVPGVEYDTAPTAAAKDQDDQAEAATKQEGSTTTV